MLGILWELSSSLKLFQNIDSPYSEIWKRMQRFRATKEQTRRTYRGADGEIGPENGLGELRLPVDRRHHCGCAAQGEHFTTW